MKYGIYCNSLERFIYVGDDLWLQMHCAKLLSGKMSLCVIDILNQDLDKLDYYSYGLKNKSQAKQNVQFPQLVLDTDGEVYLGPPLDIELEEFDRQKKFVNYLIKVANACWIADAMLNTGDHNLVLDLLQVKNLRKVADDSGIENGFIRNINTILYTSNTKQEIKDRINNIFSTYKTSERPTRMEQYEIIFRRNYITNG